MHESNYEGANLTNPGWKELLAYLALPMLLGLTVIWSIVSPPSQASVSDQSPSAYHAMQAQWNETYTVQSPLQRPLFAGRTPSPTAIVVASH